MDSMKTYLVVWLSGMVAGLVLIVRWQHLGSSAIPLAVNEGEAGADGAASAPPPVPSHNPPLTTVMIKGAKADMDHARRLLQKVTPSRGATAPSSADGDGLPNESSG
jgi:hypothetical protein